MKRMDEDNLADGPDTVRIGFAPEEILTGESTRSARLKWVVLVDGSLPPGLLANAVACVAAATGATIEGLIGQGGADASGRIHPGLPWAGCSVLVASSEQLTAAARRADEDEGVFVVDMPASAQTNRVYDGYLAELAATAEESLAITGISIVGPRKAVDRIVKRLSLL
ncbi:MAG TPA: DUF2000 domain-containing protein [Lacisediminihabitans sp.]|uniref:DUF2000 domain-containing protein n=1 Tax=Lacisediminihabitans sp. TaxID=2787631 RepID=UPI002EDB790F